MRRQPWDSGKRFEHGLESGPGNGSHLPMHFLAVLQHHIGRNGLHAVTPETPISFSSWKPFSPIFRIMSFPFFFRRSAVQFAEVREEKVGAYSLHITEIAHQSDMLGGRDGEPGFPSCDRALGNLQNLSQGRLGQSHSKAEFTNFLGFKGHYIGVCSGREPVKRNHGF